MTPSRFIPPRRARASAAGLASALVIAATVLTGCGSSSHTTSPQSGTTSSASGTSGGFTVRPFASGITIMHSTPKGRTSVLQADDIAKLGSDIYVGFQNNVGPQGEPDSSTGNLDSTIVEFSSSGAKVSQWDIAGHVDGLVGDTTTGRVIATVNEDAKSSLFVIDPASPTAVQYHYPALPHNGGTDALSFWHGMLLASASAPGTSGKAAPQASYPAVYVVSLNTGTHTASVRSLFGDEATATRANSGASGTTRLALVDPDSNAVAPSYAQRFGGQFVLDSQGDEEQIYVADTSGHKLSVLKLSQSIDDFAWASGPSGTLYVTEGNSDAIYKVTGPFQAGSELVDVTPCDAGNAPSVCPVHGFSSPYLGLVSQTTGQVTKLPLSLPIQPAGLLFVP